MNDSSALMRRFVLAVLVVLTVGCRQSAHAPSTPTPVPTHIPGFSGRVVDFTTNAGVVGARVSFGDTSAITGSDGSYVLDTPRGVYEPRIDDARAGVARVTGESYRGDFFVRTGTCIGRYGTISDRGASQPIAGATVSLGGQNVTTGKDGWYRIDFTCPATGVIGFNTTFMNVSHPDYTNASTVVGRGIAGYTRIDLEMDRR